MPWSVRFAIWGICRWFGGLTKGERMDVLISTLIYLIRLEFLDGYRTVLSGVGSIIFGIALIALAAGNDPRGDVKEGIAAIIIGVGIIGHAGKLEKNLQAKLYQIKNGTGH